MTQSRLDEYIEEQRLESFNELSEIVERRRAKTKLKKAIRRDKRLADPNQTKLF